MAWQPQPTGDGYYWLRDAGGTPEEFASPPIVVEVQEGWVLYPGDESRTEVISTTGEWWGPLVAPE